MMPLADSNPGGPVVYSSPLPGYTRMSELEEIKPGTRLLGLTATGSVEVVSVE